MNTKQTNTKYVSFINHRTMRKVLLLTPILVILASCGSTSSKMEMPSMVGVKKMTITEVEATQRFGKSSMGDTVSVNIFTYDEEGKVLRQTTYDEDGLDTEKTYTYIDSLVRMKEYTELGFASYYTTEESIYNSDGRLVYKVRKHNEEVEEDTYTYDDHGNLIYHKNVDTDKGGFGNYEENNEYKYDDLGRISSYTNTHTYIGRDWSNSIVKYEYEYKEDGTMIILRNDGTYKSKGVYDRFYNVLESYFTTVEDDSMGEADYRYEYEYDSNNRILKVLTYDGDLIESYTFYEYELY